MKSRYYCRQAAGVLSPQSNQSVGRTFTGIVQAAAHNSINSNNSWHLIASVGEFIKSAKNKWGVQTEDNAVRN